MVACWLSVCSANPNGIPSKRQAMTGKETPLKVWCKGMVFRVSTTVCNWVSNLMSLEVQAEESTGPRDMSDDMPGLMMAAAHAVHVLLRLLR